MGLYANETAEMPLEDFADARELPVSFRGYERASTDKLLRDLEEAYRALLAGRDEAKSQVAELEAQVAELERELAERREQADAVSDALIRAEQLKALSERDAQAIKEAADREAAEIRAQAEHDANMLRADADCEVVETRSRAAHEADELVRVGETAKAEAEREAAETRERAERDAAAIVRDAESRAEVLVEQVQRDLRERQDETEDFLDDARERLGSLVRDLFGRVTGGAGDGSTHEVSPMQEDLLPSFERDGSTSE